MGMFQVWGLWAVVLGPSANIYTKLLGVTTSGEQVLVKDICLDRFYYNFLHIEILIAGKYSRWNVSPPVGRTF